MKLLTASEMQAFDQATFTKLALPSVVWMENAGREVVSILLRDYSPSSVLVVTGAGNNGGDGFVVARGLKNLNVETSVFALRPVAKLKGDARQQAEAALSCGVEIIEASKHALVETTLPLLLANADVVVDAIFGTGFSSAPREEFAAAIEAINASAKPVLSIDLPSGVDASTGHVPGVAVIAEQSVTFQCLKLGHVLFPGAALSESVIVADIGLCTELTEHTDITRELLCEASIGRILRQWVPRSGLTHKGTRGHLVVLGGSSGHFGAARMCAEAGLRIGAGLSTMLLPRAAAEVLSPQLEELMCHALADDGNGMFSGNADGLQPILKGKSALVLGPGMGTSQGALEVLRASLELGSELGLPTVVDADGLNLLAKNPELESLLPATSVLTPHPGEMSRLLGKPVTEIEQDRIGAALSLAFRTKATVVLKGARTVVATCDGHVAINPAAEPALATAGSGDVLSGILGALLGFRMPDFDAACAGVFIHGKAGELAARELAGGPVGVLASDLAQIAPLVVNRLLKTRKSRARMSQLVLRNR